MVVLIYFRLSTNDIVLAASVKSVILWNYNSFVLTFVRRARCDLVFTYPTEEQEASLSLITICLIPLEL
jgi:hypothetical protein